MLEFPYSYILFSLNSGIACELWLFLFLYWLTKLSFHGWPWVQFIPLRFLSPSTTYSLRRHSHRNSSASNQKKKQCGQSWWATKWKKPYMTRRWSELLPTWQRKRKVVSMTKLIMENISKLSPNFFFFFCGVQERWLIGILDSLIPKLKLTIVRTMSNNNCH